MSRFKLAASAVAIAGLVFASVASAQVQRTFVASFGSDANTATNCGFTNPCRGFTAALSKTTSGGEVVALDAAGYGSVTITQPVTITANPGFYAGISASAGNAVTVTTTAGPVILRGLNINGIGATNGVSMAVTGNLNIENCVISNFGGNGVLATAAGTVRISDTVVRGNDMGVQVSGGATLDMYRTKANGNGSYGVYVNGDTVSTTTVGTVTDSEASGNFVGFVAANFNSAGTSKLVISRSTASFNSLVGIATQQDFGTVLLTVSNSVAAGNGSNGFWNVSGTFQTLNNNTVRQNGGTDVNGAMTGVTGS